MRAMIPASREVRNTHPATPTEQQKLDTRELEELNWVWDRLAFYRLWEWVACELENLRAGVTGG